MKVVATAIVLLANATPALGAVADGAARKVPGNIATGPGAATAGYVTPVVVITAGSKVTYTNADIVRHNVTSTKGLFNSSLAATGKSVPVVGANTLRPGTYAFFCAPHPNMKGQLIVR